MKGKSNTTYALKRMYVNNEQDLAVCKREIQITVSFSIQFQFVPNKEKFCRTLQSNLAGHKNLIGYVESSITPVGNGVHEIFLLMPFYKVHLLNLMNSK